MPGTRYMFLAYFGMLSLFLPLAASALTAKLGRLMVYLPLTKAQRKHILLSTANIIYLVHESRLLVVSIYIYVYIFYIYTR